MVEFAKDLFDAAHYLVTNQEDEDEGMTKGFVHRFSLVFSFDDFTDEEVYNKLMQEVRRKYPQRIIPRGTED